MKRALLSLVAFAALTGIVANSTSASDRSYQAPRSHQSYHNSSRHEASHRAYDYGDSRGHDYGYSTRGHGYSSHGYSHSSPSYGYGGHHSRPTHSHWSFGFGW